jgi:glycosyltransferase involved in cell wall biosynthesis
LIKSKTKTKLVFVNTHPIQYFAPLYEEIEIEGTFDLEVWYCTKHGLDGEIDKQFGTNVKWDLPLLEGYKYKFLKNHSPKAGFYNGFWGIMNFGIWSELKKLPKKSIIVVHGWHPFSAIFTIIAAKILGHISCLRAESPLVHERNRSKSSLWIRKMVFKFFLFKFIDKFLYIGTQNKLFYKHYGVNETKLIFIPYAVNNAYFQSKALELLPQKERLKEELNIPKNSKVILYSGKLISKKRPMDLLKAFHNLNMADDAFLVFVGDGELKNTLNEYIYQHNLKNVIITGFINQSQIPKYYALADVFVMCSEFGETWGLSTNEAMNFGLSVIVSDKTGNCDDLVNGNGFRFRTGDIVELSKCINKFLNLNDNYIKSMQIKSREIVARNSYKTIVDNLKLIHE